MMMMMMVVSSSVLTPCDDTYSMPEATCEQKPTRSRMLSLLADSGGIRPTWRNFSKLPIGMYSIIIRTGPGTKQRRALK